MNRNDPRSYEFALDVFRTVHGMTKGSSSDIGVELAERLQGLRPTSRRLWRSYREDSTIEVQYSDDVCDAYLLRYFPPYSHILRHILWPVCLKFKRHLPRSDRTIRCCILGGGPAPELASLHSLLRLLNLDFSRRIDHIEALIIDHNGDSWERISRVVAATLSGVPGGPKVDATTVEIALTDPDWVELAEFDLARTHLLVLQNVLNEIETARWSTFIDLLDEAVTLLPEGSVIVMVDLARHGVSRDRLKSVCTRLASTTIVRDQDNSSIRIDKPLGYVAHLLDGSSELKARRNVHVTWAVLERR